MTIEAHEDGPHGRVVVGVDGSEAALRAVRYAAAESVRTGADLVLTHAGPVSLHVGGGPLALYPLTAAEYRGVGTKIVNHARKVAREVVGDACEVRVAVVDGASPAAALADHALGARQLVVGGRQRSVVDRLLVGSVATAVAGHARVPVVVVPESWNPQDPKSVVAVGIGDLENGDELVRDAMAIAADRGATLRIIHAWELPRLYDDLAVTHMDTVQWRKQKTALVHAALDTARSDFPQVRVDVSLVHYQPAKALVAASKAADLLVLGRGRHGLRHLGATARAVLREAHCPVEVLPLCEPRPHARAGEMPQGALA